MPEIYAGHGRMGEGLGRGQRGQGMPPGGSSPTAKTRWSQEPDWLCGSQLPQGAKKGALLAEKARVPTDCLVWAAGIQGALDMQSHTSSLLGPCLNNLTLGIPRARYSPRSYLRTI